MIEGEGDNEEFWPDGTGTFARSGKPVATFQKLHGSEHPAKDHHRTEGQRELTFEPAANSPFPN
jgi:hypothetical protein